jgi:hypothetical protein
VLELAFSVFGLAAIAALFLIIPIHQLIVWWSEAVIDGGVLIGGVLASLLMLGMIVAAPQELRIVALAVVILASVVMPLIGRTNAEADTRQIHDERLDAYIAGLEANPLDPAARIALADELKHRGRLDEAIEHLEWVLQQFPRLHPTVQPRLEALRREKARPDQLPVIFCHECRAENPLGTQRCTECGAAFTFGPAFLEGLRIAGGPLAVVRAWVVLGIIAPLIVFALLEMPTIIAAPIILALLIATAWLFLRWVGGDIGKPAD